MKLFKNGKIITLNPKKENTEALLVDKDGYITATGSSSELFKQFQNHINKIIDLKGKTVIPGLNDSHLHLYQYGLAKTKVDLQDVKSIKEIKEKTEYYLKNKEFTSEDWLQGKGWNDGNFTEPRFPTREDLDEISKDIPIILKRACFHVAVVNSKALDVCEIDQNTPDPEGGKIGRYDNGQPNGIFYDEAIELIEDCIPQKDLKETKRILKDAFQDMIKAGLTSIQTDDFFNIENPEHILQAYLEMSKEEEIPLRVNLQMRIRNPEIISKLNKKGLITGFGNKYFKLGPIKLVLDGSLGARTAALQKPYSDDPSTRGTALYEQKKFNRLAAKAHENNFQLAVHAIGDRAIDMALNAFENIGLKKQIDSRPIIVHTQITNEKLNNRMKELGVIASIQPIFLKSDWQVIEKRVGTKRSQTSYAWKTMLKAGVNLSGSSDAPVEPFDPLLGIYCAITRKDFKGNPEKGWHKKECLSTEEALKLFTINSAYQSYEENIKGTLEKGKLADFLILDKDITKVKPEQIKDLNIEATYIGGEKVYES